MRLLYLVIATTLLTATTTMATAQNGGMSAPPAAQPVATASAAQAAIDRAASTGKYTFVFFWKEKNDQTDKAWSAFQPAAATFAKSADVVSIQITDPAEKQIVDRYGVSRAPMPLVLAVAPCGAITKGFNKGFGEKEIRESFVSRCTERCMKALQSRKLVFICVVDQADPQAQTTIPQGVEDFKADAKYNRATEIVLVSASDKDEAKLLQKMRIDPRTPKPVAVFLAPPGAMIGKFDGRATKEQIIAKLASAQSGCCPGGKCGPGGCGPKQ
ncbi:MAG: hypothetical protein JXA69_19070 [Phycisphaerae bacterium]|nr:hypothetical protein [Phycisphaerae bacterium]